MFCFFFNDTATTEIYTLSLHDALPISALPYSRVIEPVRHVCLEVRGVTHFQDVLHAPEDGPQASLLHDYILQDRKSTRLNSSHANISYAVFCLKKKNNIHHNTNNTQST